MTPGDRPGARPVVDRLVGRFNRLGSDSDDISRRDATALFAAIVDALRRSGRGFAQAVPTSRIATALAEFAPRLVIRDADTLKRHHRGLEAEALADALVRNASNATAATGVMGGSLMMMTKRGPWVVASIPIRLAAEAILVGAIETKLVAELHEVYGAPVPGDSKASKGANALRVWASHRGIDPTDAAGLVSLVSSVVRNPASRRAAAGASGRMLGVRGAFVTGGVTGAIQNRKQTLVLADAVRAELRRHTIGR